MIKLRIKAKIKLRIKARIKMKRIAMTKMKILAMIKMRIKYWLFGCKVFNCQYIYFVLFEVNSIR